MYNYLIEIEFSVHFLNNDNMIYVDDCIKPRNSEECRHNNTAIQL